MQKHECQGMKVFGLTLLVCVLCGCATAEKEKVEVGPDGTKAFYVAIASSEPGVKIEANGEYVGETPTEVTIWGDEDGTFHNFGSYEYVIRAIPNAGQFEQKKVFRTGAWFTQQDRIPERIYFDMKVPPSASATNQASSGPAAGNSEQAGRAGKQFGVKSILENGELLRLEDDSLWQVAPQHRDEANRWAKLDKVTVIDGADSIYPFRLVKGEKVINVRFLAE
jgi:hypothetical protein